ncbi:MAG: spermine synthase [Methylococcales bacterium]|nr:spermine synthase [Methylococcales bacterium]
MTSQMIYQTEDNEGRIEVSEENGIRSLHFGSFAQQSALSIKNPDQLHLAYAKSMMSWLLFEEIGNDDILLVGLGGGSLAKYLLQNFPDCRVEAVEYRAAVAEVAHDYFGLPRDKRLNVVIDDGARYVKERLNLQRELYSVIMLDAFDSQGMAEALCNPEFFAACKTMLKKDGILVVDLWNTTEQFTQLFSWLGSLFEAKLLFLPVHGMVNVIGLFFHENTPIYSQKTLKKRAIQLEKTFRLPFKQFLKDLIAYNPNFIDHVTSK